MRPEVHSVQDVNWGFRRQRRCPQPRDAPNAHSGVQDAPDARHGVRYHGATALTFITFSLISLISVIRRSQGNHAPLTTHSVLSCTVLHLCIHGILYSSLTTACYVQLAPIPRPPPSALRLCLQTTLRPAPPQPTLPHSPKWLSGHAGSWHCETAPLYVSYVRQDCTLGSVILPLILYTRLPWFLMHSVLGEMSAMSSKTGCPYALTLCPRGPLFPSGGCQQNRMLTLSTWGPWYPVCQVSGPQIVIGTAQPAHSMLVMSGKIALLVQWTYQWSCISGCRSSPCIQGWKRC